MEVQLDSQKHKQKGAVKRALFLDSQQPLLQRSLVVRRGENVCKHTKLYLRVSHTNPTTMVILRLHQGFCSISAAPHGEPEPEFLGFLSFQDEKEFRDKLSSIYVALNFSLDPEAPADSHGLRPILNYQIANVKEQKVFLMRPRNVLCSQRRGFVPRVRTRRAGRYSRVRRSQAVCPSGRKFLGILPVS